MDDNRMKRFLAGLALLATLTFALSAQTPTASMPKAQNPDVQASNAQIPDDTLVNGDLIFQNSRSTQSSAILSATGSPYTHMGIIIRRNREIFVLEAGPTVREVPLARWVANGVDGAHAIYRIDALNESQRSVILDAARRYLGRPYDIFFDFEGDAIYCSELPYLAFGAAGIEIGKVQSVSELNVGNAAAQRLISERWRRHPRCTGLGIEDCHRAIMAQKLITPSSIAADRQLKLVRTSFKLTPRM
jgi:hypothetical protein